MTAVDQCTTIFSPEFWQAITLSCFQAQAKKILKTAIEVIWQLNLRSTNKGWIKLGHTSHPSKGKIWGRYFVQAEGSIKSLAPFNGKVPNFHDGPLFWGKVPTLETHRHRLALRWLWSSNSINLMLVKLFGCSRRHGAVTSPSLPSPNDRAIYRVTRWRSIKEGTIIGVAHFIYSLTLSFIFPSSASPCPHISPSLGHSASLTLFRSPPPTPRMASLTAGATWPL